MRDRVKYLIPPRAFEKLRSARDFLFTKWFRPKVVTHNYGGVSLKVKVADSMSASWYDQDWAELPEIAFLKQRKLGPGARVFDLGAHQCVVALQLASIVGPSGSVVALEPGVHNYDLALQNREMNGAENLTILRAAVTEFDGTIRFTDRINGRIQPEAGKPVDCLSIETLIKRYGKPDVIFLDIEGYEAKVLEGAQSALQNDIDWYVEVHAGGELEQCGGSTRQIVDIFRSAGYSLFYQDDLSYGHPFQVLADDLPSGRFFLIALAGSKSEGIRSVAS